MNDIDNDDVTRFPITTMRLNYHIAIDVYKYLTTGPEVGLSQAVHKSDLRPKPLIRKMRKAMIRIQHPVPD